MQVRNKVLVVTGAGSGIGRALVLELLSRGARVVATDIRQEGLDETDSLAAAGDRLVTMLADVSDRDAINALPSQALDALGPVDGYIANAGIIQPFVKLKDLDYDVIQRVINVNLYGTIHMAQAFLPYLLDRPEAHLCNLASMGAFLPVPGQTIYGASKAGVKLLTEGLYAELLDTNVGVSVVMPGAVATDITTNSGVEVPGDADPEASNFPTTSPQDAANTIIDGIESDKLHIYVGKDSKLMNAASRVAPRRATHLITKQMKDLLS